MNLFTRCLNALYGERPNLSFVAKVVFNVNPRRVRAWCADEEEIPAGILWSMRELLHAKRTELGDLVGELHEAANAATVRRR